MARRYLSHMALWEQIGQPELTRRTRTFSTRQSNHNSPHSHPHVKQPLMRQIPARCVQRFILVRHGQSQGNVDEKQYVTTADWRIPLTDKGRRQSLEVGQKIRKILLEEDKGKSNIFFYVSPYRRTKQTLEGITSRLPRSHVLGIREEPRISEQQFGNFQDVSEVKAAKIERQGYGRFYYRFPNRESGFDVFNRVSSFISTVFRECDEFHQAGYDVNTMNICLVTHGLTLRLFLMRWFQYTVEEFEESFNPDNGCLILLERMVDSDTGKQWYELKTEALTQLNLPCYASQHRFKNADEYIYHDSEF